MVELAATDARRDALAGLLRAMRVAARSADSAELIATAVTALDDLESEVRAPGTRALALVVQLDEMSHAHLRMLTADVLAEGVSMTVHGLSEWRLGADFLVRLIRAYRLALEGSPNGPYKAGPRTEIMARLIRAQTNLLKWRALAYYAADDEFWSELHQTFARAREEGVHSRQIGLRQGRNAHTSVEREFVRAFALGCAWLDQLPPDAVDITDRLIRYVLPMLHLRAEGVAGARFVLPLTPAAPPRQVRAADHGVCGLWLTTAGVAPVLDELASVIAKGLVPAALASGAQARERVLTAIFQLRRQWCGAPRQRRFRRHALAGGVTAAMGFRRLKVTLASEAPSDIHAQGWQMVDVSRSGVGVRVPAEDCSRLVVGDLVGIRADDGDSWHIGLVRRIVRRSDGEGIVGLESITYAGRVASLDDGRAPAEVIVLDPVRRGVSVRVAIPFDSVPTADPIYLNQGGRISKMKRLAKVVRGTGFEILLYRVL